MIEKTNSQKTKRKRDSLGKSFSDILLQTASQENPSPPTLETGKTKEIVTNQHKQLVPPNQTSDNPQKLLDIKIIGLILKEKREENGITLDNISNILCLKSSLLKSIELGNWENLPHKVYVRGYIRKYADLLGVYGEVMPYLTEDKTETKSEKIRDKAVQRPKLSLLPLPKKTPRIMLLCGVVITLMLGFFLIEGDKKQSSEMSKLENGVQVASDINENNTKKNIPNFIDTKKLIITCHERTWISVIIDGTEKKEFTLKPQEVVILNAKEKFDLLIGNAGGIRLLLDGKDTSFTGVNGQVKRVTLS